MLCSMGTRTDIVQLAHRELQGVDIAKIEHLLSCVNLTQRELDIIRRTELYHEPIKDLQERYYLSYTGFSKSKRKAMEKIGAYLMQSCLIS